jgi:hypothetical protein
MKEVYIFVEGPTDAEFLRRILPAEVLSGAEIVPAGGSAGIPSLARTVLVRRKKPVVVIMDADSLDPDSVEERKESTAELIQAADASVPVKVIAVVPEIEAWFFAAPEAIARILGEPVPSELVSRGKRDPKGVLHHLAEKNHKVWDASQAIRLLSDDDINRMRALPEMHELIAFLTKMHQAAA